MDQSIIAAIIGALGTIIAAWLTSRKTEKQSESSINNQNRSTRILATVALGIGITSATIVILTFSRGVYFTQSGTATVSSKDPTATMDKGVGVRQQKVHINFAQPFKDKPQVVVSLMHIDAKIEGGTRIEVNPDDIQKTGFDMVFTTWADSQVAGAKANWVAHGEK